MFGFSAPTITPEMIIQGGAILVLLVLIWKAAPIVHESIKTAREDRRAADKERLDERRETLRVTESERREAQKDQRENTRAIVENTAATVALASKFEAGFAALAAQIEQTAKMTRDNSSRLAEQIIMKTKSGGGSPSNPGGEDG
jgi:septal ring factor EnvC (AmiA/AmiB activator)